MRIIGPRTGTMLGEAVPERLRAARLDISVPVKLRWDLRDAGYGVRLEQDCDQAVEGAGIIYPSDLFPGRLFPPRLFPGILIPDSESLVVRLKAVEAVGGGSPCAFDGTVLDAERGLIELDIPAGGFPRPGIYEAEIGIFDSPETPAYIERLLVAAERSLFGAAAPLAGPPTLQEVRLRLRDSSPAESRLLAGLEFDDAEILTALCDAVRSWNGAMPPIPQQYTTCDFFSKSSWLVGARARLLSLAAGWYRKNSLSYAAGGVQVQDLDRAEELERLAQLLHEQYSEFIARTKTAMNLRRGARHISGPAGWVRGVR